jgi:hypothetical protein
VSADDDSPQAPGGTTGGVPDERATGDDPLQLSTVDVAFLVFVPAVLVGVFLLPMGLRRELALRYTEPSLRTMYAAHFVHFDFPHLVSNLLVYLLVVPFSLAVSAWSGRRRRFYVVAVTILLAFPLLLSGLNVLFPRPQLGVGFSGLNLAFVGYLPHVLADRFEAKHPEWERSRAALLALAFFVGTGIITARVAMSIRGVTRTGLWMLLAAGAGSVVTAAWLLRPVVSRLRTNGVTGGTVPPLVVLGGLLFVILMVVSFPEVSSTGRSVVDIFLHLLGFSFGYLIPYTAFQVLGLSVGNGPLNGSPP